MSMFDGQSNSNAHADAKLLAASIESLKRKGSIEYTGEYGDEVVAFIPFVAWLKSEGLLAGRQVITYEGMRPYYFFLDEEELMTKPGPRRYVPPPERTWPTNDTITATRQKWHAFPDFRSHYAKQGRSFSRPVLFIQNKFHVEWNLGPINYLPLAALEMLFELSGSKYSVVYSRPRNVDSKGYSRDHNTYCDYPDLAVAKKYKIEVLEDFCLEAGADYNQTKLEILAKAHVFVAVQGGGANLLPYFGQSLLLVLHLRGNEIRHAYSTGAFKYLSNPPPIVLVATNNRQLIEGINVVNETDVLGGAAVIRPAARKRMSHLLR